tara:strand:- start:9609 stop:10280 length:672 start_codon:yes stop_codon:yes gene_type:complete
MLISFQFASAGGGSLAEAAAAEGEEVEGKLASQPQNLLEGFGSLPTLMWIVNYDSYLKASTRAKEKDKDKQELFRRINETMEKPELERLLEEQLEIVFEKWSDNIELYIEKKCYELGKKPGRKMIYAQPEEIDALSIDWRFFPLIQVALNSDYSVSEDFFSKLNALQQEKLKYFVDKPHLSVQLETLNKAYENRTNFLRNPIDYILNSVTQERLDTLPLRFIS